MKLFKSALLILVSVAVALAQNPQNAELRAEDLRGQLRGVIDKEAELQTRLQQIEEDLKPENIQRSIALIGTTRPEDLREQRRLQLERDREGVRSQLEQLATSRTRLEASIATAEAEANRQRMQANTPPPPVPTPTASAGATATTVTTTPPRKPVRPVKKRQRRPKTRRH